MSYTHKIVQDSQDYTQKGNQEAVISLSNDLLSWKIQNHETAIALDHVIGVQYVQGIPNPSNIIPCLSENGIKTMADKISESQTALWAVFAMMISKDKKGDPKAPKLRQITFQSTPETSQLISAIRASLKYSSTKKILFLLNPFGGTGGAKKVYHDVVLPMLKIAGVINLHELVETTHRNHATELAQTLDVSKYCAAATISGDGVFHELLNGLLGRHDWKTAAELPIGTIGAGSSNAIGKNLDTVDPLLATLSILKCNTRKMDIFSVIQNNTVLFSHLMISWTFIADIDIESERFRSLGALRMTLMAIIRLIKFRNYKGRLYLLPFENAENFQLPEAQNAAYPGNYI